MRIFSLIFILFIMSGCGAGEPDNNIADEDTEPVTEEAPENEQKTQQTDDDSTQQSSVQSEPVEIIKDEREGIRPERIEIPAIDVDAPVDHMGLNDEGEMAVPESLHETAWYEPGYKVGAPGSSVIAGHVDDTVNPGVFKQLHTLEAGDEIIVHDGDGSSLTFIVRDKELFDADEAPVDQIFGYSHRSLLNLITCEGPYDYDAGGTPNRWVVYTELDSE